MVFIIVKEQKKENNNLDQKQKSAFN